MLQAKDGQTFVAQAVIRTPWPPYLMPSFGDFDFQNIHQGHNKAEGENEHARSDHLFLCSIEDSPLLQITETVVKLVKIDGLGRVEIKLICMC